MSDALLKAWERTLRRNRSARAIVQAADGATRTFGELDAHAHAWLRDAAEDRDLSHRTVVFAVPNGIRWLEIFIALVRAGAVAVPLDAGEPPAAQRRIAEKLRAHFWWDGNALVTLSDRKTPDARLIKLTSGSTGEPRGLAFTAEQLLADAKQVTSTMGITSADLNYALVPFGHSYGLGNVTLPLVAMGIPVVVGTAPLPHVIADDFQRWRPTVFPGVPALWRALAQSEVPPKSLASLRLGISAGAPLPIDIAVQHAVRFGGGLHSFYGTSETGGIAYDRTGVATLAGGVGQAMRGVRIEALRGERISICSAAVFTIGNRRRKVRGMGRWLPSDRVLIADDGQLKLTGRRGQIVKIGGRRVNLAEVATRLRKIAGVRDVWVSTGGGDAATLGAAVATSLTVEQLRTALAGDTASWKIPKRWAILPALPTSQRGKIDAAALRAMLFG